MAVKRKKSSGGGANWMDTYGDMVTLLLCFFVLLYSMSTISEDNWKAIVMSFNPKAIVTPTATEGGNGPIADEDNPGAPIQNAPITQEEIDQDMEALYQALQEYVSQEGAQNRISVTKGDGKVFVAFNDAVFFDGYSPVLRQDAFPILDTVSGMLSEASDAIDEVRVQGHTAQSDPNEPNDVKTDRTLSSQRATNVVIYVQEHSTVDPARLISEGLGQWRPVASNDTSEERAKNRRVEMIISGRNIENEMAEGIQQYETQGGGVVSFSTEPPTPTDQPASAGEPASTNGPDPAEQTDLTGQPAV